MRLYRIDDLTLEQSSALTDILDAMDLSGGMDGIYWLPVPENMLTAEQREHITECGPFAMALEVEENFLQLEFLVRARNKLRCSCVSYASSELEQHMMRYVESLFTQLDIPI